MHLVIDIHRAQQTETVGTLLEEWHTDVTYETRFFTFNLCHSIILFIFL